MLEGGAFLLVYVFGVLNKNGEQGSCSRSGVSIKYRSCKTEAGVSRLSVPRGSRSTVSWACSAEESKLLSTWEMRGECGSLADALGLSMSGVQAVEQEKEEAGGGRHVATTEAPPIPLFFPLHKPVLGLRRISGALDPDVTAGRQGLRTPPQTRRLPRAAHVPC